MGEGRLETDGRSSQWPGFILSNELEQGAADSLRAR